MLPTMGDRSATSLTRASEGETTNEVSTPTIKGATTRPTTGPTNGATAAMLAANDTNWEIELQSRASQIIISLVRDSIILSIIHLIDPHEIW